MAQDERIRATSSLPVSWRITSSSLLATCAMATPDARPNTSAAHNPTKRGMTMVASTVYDCGIMPPCNKTSNFVAKQIINFQ